LPVDQSASVVHEPLTGAFHSSLQPPARALAGITADNMTAAPTLATTIAAKRDALIRARCR
jgi:hypothetical protein